MKTNQGVKTLIVVLVLAIVGLTTFIVVDKIILNKGTETKKDGQNLTTGNVNSNDEQAITINTLDISGVYEFEKVTSEENISVNYSLDLFKDGSYSYRKSIGFPRGTMGTYTVSGDTVILTAKYQTASDPSLGIYKNPKTIILNLNQDGSISDKNSTENKDELGVFATNGDVDYTNIILKKLSNPEENSFWKTYKSVTEIVNDRPEGYEYIIDETGNGTTTNTTQTSAIEEIKKALKDENWVKQNVGIQESEIINNGANANDQELTFAVCKNTSVPVIVVQAYSENSRFSKITMVTYKDGTVKAEKINQGHIYHGGSLIDINKAVVYSGFMHQGIEATVLNNISDGTIKFVGQISKENNGESIKYFKYDGGEGQNETQISQTEYEQYEASLNLKQYNFTEISTKLTNANVDMYVK